MPRRRLPSYLLGCIASLVSLLGAGASTAAAFPPLQTYSAGLPATADPTLAAPAVGGGIWFAQSVTGMPLGRITSAGTIIEQAMPTLAADLAAPPTGLAAAPDGDVWLADGHSILQVTPAGAVTNYAGALPAATAPQQLAIGPDGGIWFTDQGTRSIGHISVGGVVTEYGAGLGSGAQLGGIAAGPGGDMWFTDCHGGVGSITAQGVIALYPTGACAQEIVDGPDANVWFTESGALDDVGRVAPTGAVSEFPTGARTQLPQFITPGPDGQLYFTEPFGFVGPALAGLASVTTGGLVRQDLIAMGFVANAWDVVTASNGNLWVTLPGQQSAIGLLSFAPAVTAGAPVTAGPDEATLVGDLLTNGESTTSFFQYGPTVAYGTNTAPATSVGGTTALPVSVPVSGLMPNTLYHYRLVATNAGGTTDGPDATFTTMPAATSATTDSTPTVTTTTSLTTTADTESASSTSTTTTTVTSATDASDPPAATAPAGGVLGATGQIGAATADGGLAAVSLAPLSLVGVTPGQAVAAGPVSGTLYAHARGARARFALHGRAVLPFGSKIDARTGIVKFTAYRETKAPHVATVAAAVPETIALSGGLFSIAQPADGGGYIVITLLGGRFRSCPSLGSARIAATRKVPTTTTTTSVVRQLWSKDAGGAFSTHGRDSVGTVQGTVWLTADRCDGTVTHVADGRVLVVADHVNRQVELRAGQSYLAPAVGR